MEKTRTQKLRGYLLSAVTVALGLIALGFIALWVASQLHDQTAATVVREFAAVLLALGVLELAHRFILERSLVREILTLVHLEQRVLELGLEDLAEAPPDWADFFGDGNNFAIVPADPVTWLRTEWVRVLDRAKQSKITISVYVPAWTGSGLAAVASRLDTTSAQLAAELSRSVRGVSDSWAHSTDLKKGSVLTINVYDDVVAYGIAISDKRSILLLPDGRGLRPGGTVISAHFRAARLDLIPHWLDGQVKQLHTRLEYTGTVP